MKPTDILRNLEGERGCVDGPVVDILSETDTLKIHTSLRQYVIRRQREILEQLKSL